MPLLLLELYGSRKAARLPARVLIGRRSMNHLVIESTAVSRMHAWIDRVGGGFVLTDMTSRTGTHVNGVRLTGSRPLVDKDVISIGPARLTFLQGDTPPLGFELFEIPRQPNLSEKDVGIRFDCPHCRAPMWAAPQFAGNVGTCAYCGEEFTIPGGTGAAPTTAPVARLPESATSGRIVPRQELQTIAPEPALPAVTPKLPPARPPTATTKATVNPAVDVGQLAPKIPAPAKPAASVKAVTNRPRTNPVPTASKPAAGLPVAPRVASEAPRGALDTLLVAPDAGTLSAAEGISQIAPAPKPPSVHVSEAQRPLASPSETKPVRPAAPPTTSKSSVPPQVAPPVPAPPVAPKAPAPSIAPPTPARPTTKRSPSVPLSETPRLTPPTVLSPLVAVAPAVPAVSQPPTLPSTPAPGPKAICGVCQTAILPNEVLTRCPSCGLAFHEECWQENFGCSAYGCNQTNVLKPPETEPDPQTVPPSDIAESTQVDLEAPPGTPWEFVLLGLSALGVLASGVSFGGASFVALLVTGGYYLKKRESQNHKPAAVFAAMALSIVGIFAGAAVSYFLFLYGPKRS